VVGLPHEKEAPFFPEIFQDRKYTSIKYLN
jgi:hypothetical protein